MNKKLISMISICNKARKLSSGEFACETGIKKNKARLILIANDASDNTKKKFGDLSKHRGIPIYYIGDKSSLGRCIGKDNRASIIILDNGFSKNIISIINEMG